MSVKGDYHAKKHSVQKLQKEEKESGNIPETTSKKQPQPHLTIFKVPFSLCAYFKNCKLVKCLWLQKPFCPSFAKATRQHLIALNRLNTLKSRIFRWKSRWFAVSLSLLFNLYKMYRPFPLSNVVTCKILSRPICPKDKLTEVFSFSLFSFLWKFNLEL